MGREHGTTEVEGALAEALERLSERSLGARPVGLQPVEAGLGRRRFIRLHFEPGGSSTDALPPSAMARIDAPEDPRARPTGVAPEPPLEPIRALLEGAGLPVPRLYGRDPARGIELLEDLGDRSLERAWPLLDAVAQRSALERAAALVGRVQRVACPKPPIAAFERRLDGALFRYKARQLIDHGLPFARSRATSAAEARVVDEAFAAIADEAARAPARLAHRDFKAANLHLRPGGDELVMIDLQGALLAPPEYDLVCLLRDLQIEVPEAWTLPLLHAGGAGLPDAPPRDALERRFQLLTLSRVGKDFSRFALVWQERGDARFARPLPRAARMLAAAATSAAGWAPAHARLAELLSELPGAPGLSGLDELAEPTPCAP